jgi:hypothetical protein
MAETYLNLLNSAAQVSANVYEQIDRSMSQRIAIESQAGRFEVEAMGKAAQFAEQQRMNNEQIINMRADNYMQAQRFEAEKMLIPIKMQTANLQLEAQRLNLQRAKEIEGKNHFNSLTSIYDDQIGYALLETESTDMAQEYLGYKAKVSDYISKGGKFDSGAFEKGLIEIRSKYKDAKPSDPASIEYDPQKQYLFEQVSPKLGASYATRHPAVQGSRNSIAVSYYSAENANEAAEFSKYNRLYSEEDIGKISVGRDAVMRNKRTIDNESRKANEMRNQIAAAQAQGYEEKSIAGMKSVLEQYENNINNAVMENQTLITNASKGIFGIPEKVTAVAPQPEGGASGAKTDISRFNNPDTTMGIESPKRPELDTTGQQTKAGVDATFLAIAGSKKSDDGKSYIPLTDIQDTELSQVDLSWWNKSGMGDEPTIEAKKQIKDRVKLGVDMKLGDKGNINDLVTRDKVESLLKTIDKDVAIPVSGWLNEELQKAKTNISVLDESGLLVPRIDGSLYNKGGEYEGGTTIWFGKKKEDIIGKIRSGGLVTSADEIFSAVNKIPKGAKRDEAMREIYEALTTASISNAVTNKDK